MRARAEDLVRFLLRDLHEDLQALGRLDVLRRVTEKSLGYLRFPSRGPNSTAKRSHNRCIAYINIGDVLADQGKKPEALEAYQKAREIAQRLVALDPARLDWLLSLADCHDRYGLLLYHQGRAQESRVRAAGRPPAQAPGREMQSGQSENRSGRRAKRHKLGILFWRNQELPKALEHHLESLDCLRRLAKRIPPWIARPPLAGT